MTPTTLHVRTEKFLRNFINSIPSDKDLHLLIDLVRLEEFPHTIQSHVDGSRTYHFDYFILEEEKERDEFFDKFHEFKSFYSPMGKTNKLIPEQIKNRIEQFGFSLVTKKMVSRFGNPIKVKTMLDKKANKKYRRYT